jgi:hypothetical protein
MPRPFQVQRQQPRQDFIVEPGRPLLRWLILLMGADRR